MDFTTELKQAESGVCGAESPHAADATWCVQLAERIGAGDTQAEELLIQRLRPGLQMMLVSRCRDPDLASDLCQDTLIIVLKRLRSRTMEDPSRLAAFAAQTARQLVFDARRRHESRKTDADSDAVDSAQLQAPAVDPLDQASIASFVRALLAELPHERDREILRQLYLFENDKPDICKTFSLSSGAFDQIVFRARARLRAMIAARGMASRDFLCAFGLWVPKSWLH